MLAYPRADPKLLCVWNNENDPAPCALGKRQGSIAAACTVSSATSTSMASVQPSPTAVGSVGFHVGGLFTTNQDGSADNTIEVIGTQNDLCSYVANNKNKYSALAVDVEGVNATLTGFIRDPSEINSTTVEFALLTNSDPQLKPVGQPLCGVTSEPNFAMVFTNSGSGTFGRSKVPSQMEIGLMFDLAYKDTIGNTGVCTPSSSTTGCKDAKGKSFTMVGLLFCEVYGNPTCCSNW